MLTTLQGQIERITYTNEENGYTIARLKVYGERDLVTAVGTLLSPMPGEVITMKGEWTSHPKYGQQFKIVSYETKTPASVHGIEKYLGSGLIKGIGPVMAKRIVKKFKENTLNIIEHSIDRLTEIEGIGEKRIDMIREAWAQQREIRDVMVFLQAHGVSSGYATKIFKHYGSDSIERVRENPYRLATDIFGIGFVTADRIAEKLGIARNSPVRAQAGVLYILNQCADEGHVYYPYDLLVDKACEILDIDSDIIARAIDAAAEEKTIVVEQLRPACEALEKHPRAVYLAPFHTAETRAAERLRMLIDAKKSIREIDCDKALSWVQQQLSITLAEKQIEAVKCAIEHKVLVITGGPGTGKSTIVNAILNIFSRLGINIMLAAPTGRAAKRMSEITGREAKTIHRLLKYSLKGGGFEYNEGNPLPCDLLVVDEASMIDTILMHHLLKAVPSGATLILVGDVNQLPSVGAGTVLNDIIRSGAVQVVELTEIFRQARESLIVVNAHKINSGEMPLVKTGSDSLEDFYFIEKEDPEEVLALILELAGERIPRRFNVDAVDDIQVLTPMHKGIIGSESLNGALQKRLNPREDGITRGSRRYSVSDKVMQIKNDYDRDVFNGDVGRILTIDTESQELAVSFDGRRVVYDFSDLDEIVPAYAVSVHKSQGSEYPVVIIPVLTQHYLLLQRNLLYTGVTRGKRLVVVVGTKKAMAIAVKNNKTARRYTHLQYRLIQKPDAG